MGGGAPGAWSGGGIGGLGGCIIMPWALVCGGGGAPVLGFGAGFARRAEPGCSCFGFFAAGSSAAAAGTGASGRSGTCSPLSSSGSVDALFLVSWKEEKNRKRAKR